VPVRAVVRRSGTARHWQGARSRSMAGRVSSSWRSSGAGLPFSRGSRRISCLRSAWRSSPPARER
jgi:hypothetical protein